MSIIDQIQTVGIDGWFNKYSYSKDFFDTMGLPVPCSVQGTLQTYFNSLDPVLLENLGIEQSELMEQFVLFVLHMEQLKEGSQMNIDSLTIIGGQNKEAHAENISVDLIPGEIIAIVGPTGSGKSRLLADIEWMAQRDTPTQRQILINNSIPPEEWRFSAEHKLVAQLSQNMNFVMDLDVYHFVELHAKSRMIDNPEKKVNEIIFYANELAGELFDKNTPITSLSGGQSRALMIADTAFLSTSPIILIDEIENAGIERKKALDLLVQKDKIVLMATHDPILALMADKRIVIKNGGIYKVIHTTENEKLYIKDLEKIDKKLMNCRDLLRSGAELIVI